MPKNDNFDYEEGFKTLKDTLESADKLSSHFINMLEKSKPACNKIIDISKFSLKSCIKAKKKVENLQSNGGCEMMISFLLEFSDK